MARSFKIFFCAFFLLALFTLDSKGLSRVEHRGIYRPANTTFSQQNQFSPQQPQQQQYGQQQPSYQTTRNPNQNTWNAGQTGNTNYNQWNRFNTTHGTATGAGSGFNNNNNNYNSYNQTNQWPRYNNTFGQPGWNTPGMKAQNQSHLYPNLPAQNPWIGSGGVRPQTQQQYTTPQPPFNNQQWGNNNNNNRWNNTYYPSQQFPGGVQPNRTYDWWMRQNKNYTVTPTTPLPNTWRNPNSGGGYIPTNQQTNLWNTTNNMNNNGWRTSGASGVGGTTGQNNGFGTGQNNWGNSGTNTGPNTWPNNAQTTNNWQGGNNGLNTNNNWQHNLDNSKNTGIQSGQSASGVPLAPIGGSSMAGGQVPSNGIPLAPMGGGTQQWNGGSNIPNAWNSGNSGSPQLAPLAPLSYGGGGNVVDPYKANTGSSNPYATIFN